jgi:DNA-binding transcriptional ArsR family regulator
MPTLPIRKDPRRAEHVANVLRAIAHPLRVRIVATLCRSEEHVSALAEELDAPQTIVSQQLRILRSERLVEVRKERGHAYYSLAEPALRDLVCCMEKCRA